MKVVYFKSCLPEGIENQYPFKEGEHLLYLGEIENMLGHGVVINEKGKVFWGFHTEHFIEMGDDDF